MSQVNNPSNDVTSYSNYQYNRNDFATQQNYAGSLNDISSSVNKLWELSLLSAIDNFIPEDYAFYTQIRDPEEDTYAMHLMRLNVLGASLEPDGPNNSIVSATQMLTRAGQSSGISNVLNGSIFNGPPLVYIPPDNGDQFRMIGNIVVDAVPDSGIRLVVTNYSLNEYRTESGNADATAIPYPRISGTQNIDYNAELTLYFGPQYTPFFLNSGPCNCTPLTGSCANGYRRVTFIKQRNFTPGSETQHVNGWVVNTEFNPLGDGGYSITVKLGLSRKNNNAGALTFEENVPFDLEVGDFILFGGVDPTTQCTPEPCCVKAAPRVYAYCSTTQRTLDCIYEDLPYTRRVQERNKLDWRTETSYIIYSKIRDVALRIANELMFSQPYYAQGQRLPLPISGVIDPLVNTEYSDCEVIPTATRGIMPTIEDFGRSYNHYFTSCNDTCGQYKIERFMELMIDSMQGKNVYNDTGWKFVGATRPMKQYQANMRQFASVIPTDYQEAQRVERMRGASFRNDAKSFFGPAFDADSTDTGPFVFGGKIVPAMNDLTLQAIYQDTMWFVSDNAFLFFAPDIDALERRLVSENYYFPATGQRGKLVPNIISQDLVPTMINGTMDFKARKNCGIKYYAYMEYGIHPRPEYLPHMTKFSYGARQDNPAFDPAQPEGPDNMRYIYGSIQDLLDCGCSAVEAQVRDSVLYWTQV